jgi:hypothetical protein
VQLGPSRDHIAHRLVVTYGQHLPILYECAPEAADTQNLGLSDPLIYPRASLLDEADTSRLTGLGET